LGLLLAPTSVLAILGAGKAVVPLAVGLRQSFPFLAGLLGYPVLHFALLRPLRFYIFGHELTHALAAVLCGYRVMRFHSGASQGYVHVSRSNAFVALAPYCIPLYAIIVLAAYRLACLWVGGRHLDVLFLVLMGLSLSFHLVLTLDVLVAQRQRDLVQAGGVVFSLAVIALANAAALVLAFKVLFPDAVSLRAFALELARGTGVFWTAAIRTCVDLGRFAHEWLVRLPEGARP